MAYNHEYPYFSADNANVDWFLDFVNRLHKEWEDMKKDWNDVLTEWDGMKNTWEEYRQDLENRFGEFTTNITNQFGALRLEFTDLKQEFDALKIYVETQINNLPDEVKNIFQSYIDDGTILEMIKHLVPEDLKEQVEKNKNDIAGLTASLATLTTTVEGHTTQITNLTTKVNQNTTNITTNASNIAKNTTDIASNKLNIQNLTTTVGQHTTEISNIKTKQTEIMNDIADINTLDEEQNNRLSALEDRGVLTQTQEFLWLLINNNLVNLKSYITSLIGSSFIEAHTLSAGFAEANTAINTITPSKKPTRIIIIVDDSNLSSDVDVTIQEISDITYTARKKYPCVHVYCTAGPSPAGTINTIRKMSQLLNRVAGTSSIVRNPYMHICIRPVLASYPNVAKNNLGDFSHAYREAYEYVLEVFNSIFAPQFGDSNIVFKIPINIDLGTDTSGIAHMILILHNSYLEMYIEAEMPGGNNSNFDIAGRTGETLLGTISGIYNPYVPPNVTVTTAILSFFSRDNRSSGSHSAYIWLQPAPNSTTRITISNRDFDAASIVNGYTIMSRKFFDWSAASPINE